MVFHLKKQTGSQYAKQELKFESQTESITVTILNKNCYHSFNVKSIICCFIFFYLTQIKELLQTINTTNLLIRITHHSDILQPEYLKHDNSLVITSPVNLTLEPRSDAWIDLKFNIEFEQKSDLYEQSIWIKPSTVLGTIGFDIEDKETWFMNKTKQNTIQLHVFNKSFYYKVRIKKNDILGFGFLLAKKDGENLDISYKIKNS